MRAWSSEEHVQIRYTTDDEYRQIVATQFSAALENGEKIAYVADTASRLAILGWLSASAPGVDAVLERGQLVIWAPPDRALLSNQFLDLLASRVNLAGKSGYAGLRLSVDVGTALRALPARESVAEHEELVNNCLAENQLAGLRLMCCYDGRRFPDEQLDEVGKAHATTLTAEQVRRREPILRTTPLEDRPGLRLAGEVDKSNVAELSEVLDSLFDEDDIYLDVSDLHYADVGSVEMLVHAADNSRAGRCLVLCSPAPIIRTILRIYGWDELPGLRLVEETTR